MKLNNLTLRFVTVAPLIPIILLAIFWHRHEGLWALVFACTVIALLEYFAITHDDKVDRWFGVGLGATCAAVLYWWPPALPVVLPATAIVPALYYLFRFRDLKLVAGRLGLTSFGVVYAGVGFTYLALQKRVFGHEWVLLTLMIAWFGDTGAYFAGRFLGKTKLYPAVSPGKTWAGAFGGLAGSFGASVLANLWFFPRLGWLHGAVLTIVGGALGQSGDLVESMFKRSFGVKDSGQILPGHGGMLDRIDAVLFISPFVFLYAGLIWR